ncbi:helix-turn-helix transcriptional regulator [Pectobacterium aroidearum]|uniref:Helix-turn-helix transcriptional regulator n=1 Tax=Pectobacterium aroidearum TaxID=1201031 RepID=A0ABR5ZJM9_9GAMM|nr:helix-turn-helix transcriptional regulator [Pectobacterium aroidearum]MBA5234776.1 helix-turn-helix transcriptional regulator [Pectobacterium aroidearum]MBA5739955.1 helix-turn-helix transcriptional regulator [Pectobacterium aroidearum]
MTVDLKELKERMLNTPESIRGYEEADRELALIQVLYDMRERAGITKADLAKRLDVAQSALNRLEKNPLGASVRTLQKYADACGAKIEIKVSH